MKNKFQASEKGFVDVVDEIRSEYDDAWIALNMIQQNTDVDIGISVSRRANKSQS